MHCEMPPLAPKRNKFVLHRRNIFYLLLVFIKCNRLYLYFASNVYIESELLGLKIRDHFSSQFGVDSFDRKFIPSI